MEENCKYATSQILEGVVKDVTTDRITIQQMTLAMKASGFGVIMFLFSLPIVIPLPPPTPSITAIPLLLFAFQMALGLKGLWLPKWLGNLSVKRTTLALLFEKSAPFIRRFERVVKRRLVFMSSQVGERMVGLLSFVFALSILIPLPFTNLLPGIGIVIMSFGLIGKDGFIVLLGIFVGILGLLFTMTMLLFGKEALGILIGLMAGL
jgi:hypothetical protein